MDKVTRGPRTTEFWCVFVVGFFAVLAGFTIKDNVVNYALNETAWELFSYVVGVYIGGRSIVKAVDRFKKPDGELSELKQELQSILKEASK